MVEYEKETEGCTFVPKLNQSSLSEYLLFLLSNLILDNYQSKAQTQGDIYERSNIWRLQKDIKIDEERIKQKSSKQKECTFKPKINKSSNSFKQSVYL